MKTSMKKRIIIVGAWLFCVALILVAVARPFVFVTSHRDITSDRAMRRMPNLYITSDDILLLNNIASAPELEKEINSEDLNAVPDNIIHGIIGDMLCESMTSLRVTAGMGIIFFHYIADNHRVILTLTPYDYVTKTVARLRSSGRARTIYENFNNESYRVYRTRLRLF